MPRGNPTPFSLVCVIVPHGHGSHVVRLSHQLGASGGTIIPVHGTAAKRWLQFLQLDDIRRDLVLMVVTDDCTSALLDGLDKELRFQEKNTGIAFSLPASHLIGTDHLPFESTNDGCSIVEETDEKGYLALFVIVDEDVMEDVVLRTQELGAPGASTMLSYGSADKADLVFDVPVAPKKPTLLVVAEATKATEIAKDLGRTFGLDQPGKGILFAVPVCEVRGLRRA